MDSSRSHQQRHGKEEEHLSDFVLVGVGARARIGQHIATLEAGSAIRYTVDPSPKAAERAVALFGGGVRHFSSLDDFMRDVGAGASSSASGHSARSPLSHPKIAGAIVCSPDDTHAKISEILLEAGIPVYLEKPMALTLADADRIIIASKSSGAKLYVGHNMRHMDVVRQMKRIIDDGLIGQVQAVWCRHFVGDGGDYYFKDWHAEREHSSTLLLQKGAHDLDVIHYLAGGYSEVVQGLGALMVYDQTQGRAGTEGKLLQDWYSRNNWPPRAQTNMNPVIDVEDISMLQMRLDNGVLASYQQCHFTPDYWRNYTVIGDAGRLENFGDSEGGVVRVWNRRHGFQSEGDLEFPITGDKAGHGDADVLTMAEFLRFMRGGGPTVATVEGARAAVATAIAGVESLRKGGAPQNVDRHLVVPVYSAQQVRDAEIPYLKRGVPLMMRAAVALAEVAARMVTWSKDHGPVIIVLVGSGNNGGDALYAAAELAFRGATVLAVPLGQRWHEAAMTAALEAGVSILEQEEVESASSNADLIIDGILGTGTTGDPTLRGVAAKVVKAMSAARGSSTQVLAVDIPSGMHPDTGRAGPVVLRADVTVTFGGVKRGLLGDAEREGVGGGELAGQIVLAPIGIEEQLLKVDPVGWVRVAEVMD